MDGFWKEGYFTMNRLSFRVYQSRINSVQTLVFYSINYQSIRHWVDFVHLLSENNFFHSRKKVGSVVHPTLCKCWYFTVEYRG